MPNNVQNSHSETLDSSTSSYQSRSWRSRLVQRFNSLTSRRRQLASTYTNSQQQQFHRLLAHLTSRKQYLAAQYSQVEALRQQLSQLQYSLESLFLVSVDLEQQAVRLVPCIRRLRAQVMQLSVTLQTTTSSATSSTKTTPDQTRNDTWTHTQQPASRSAHPSGEGTVSAASSAEYHDCPADNTDARTTRNADTTYQDDDRG